MKNASFDAALIAGGKSRRFGRDKAFLEWKGEPLYAIQLRKLAALEPGQLWLSTNQEQKFPSFLEGVTRINDQDSDLGPIAGLHAVFEASSADYVVVLGVDLPLMTAGFLRGLVEAGEGVVARTQYWEPLVATYPREAMLAILRDALEEKEKKLQRILDKVETAGVIRAFPPEAGELELFTNVNTEEDFQRIEKGRFDESVRIVRHRKGIGGQIVDDVVASEEPLEVRVNGQSIAVMMRTPGHDDELAAGFLVTENVIDSREVIQEIAHCPDVDPEGIGNTLDVRLSFEPDFEALTRHVFTSSSCGVCGKATIESVFQNFPAVKPQAAVSADVLLSLPDKLREQQKTFDRTGGLHASALFSRDGELILLREDVGRHNALDKVIGYALLHEKNLEECILLVSGRISFELMQKALAARIGVVAGISAPSSLAVSLARESGQTLVGFLRERGFNLYHGKDSE